MCLFSLMLIRCAICFSVNCFGIHMAGFPLLPQQTGTGRGQEDRETEKETEIWQRFGNSSSVYFQRVEFSLETSLKSCSLNSSIPFFFYEDVVSFFPPLLSAAHSTWSCWDPLHSGSLWWEGWTPLSSTLRGKLFFFQLSHHCSTGWSGEKSSHSNGYYFAWWT